MKNNGWKIEFELVILNYCLIQEKRNLQLTECCSSMIQDHCAMHLTVTRTFQDSKRLRLSPECNYQTLAENRWSGSPFH